MKICFIDSLFCWPPRGGADVDTYNVLLQLRLLGYDILLITLKTENLTRGNISKSFNAFEISCIEIESLGKRTLDKIQYEILSKLEIYVPDIIIVGNSFFLKPVITSWLNWRIPIAWRQYAYELICQKDIQRFRNNCPCTLDYLSTPNTCRECFIKHSRNKFVSLSTDPWLEEYLSAKAYSKDYYSLLMESIKKVKVIWVYSQPMKNVWEKYHHNVEIIPGGVDINLFRPIEKLKEKQDVIRILASGRIQDESKGLIHLIKACELLREDFPELELICTSPWQYGLPSWIKFVGWLSYYELPKIYQSADICVVPSIWEEPFGLVTLEAMASGLPVVVSKIGGLREIIIEGKNGVFFNPGDPISLKNKLKELISNPQLRSEISKEAKEYVVSNFSWEKIAKNYYSNEIERIATN